MKEMVGGCCVCSDERGWPENPLVYCDGQNCTVAVHQACYGIVTVPTGPWYCRKCESQERSARVRCELCPSRDGALKKTDNQGWAHVVCALYIPEVRFGNVTTMEPIILQLIPQERYAKTCYICQEIGKPNRATVGACMQCNKSTCKQQFHVTCAQSLGLLCEEAGNYLDNVKYCGYCQHHYSKLKKGGNVKTIPPYKPITHDTSSDSGSSPEKEIDSTVNATSSSTSATSIKIMTNINASSSTTSVSSTKQRKSSTASKQSNSSSSSSSSSSSAIPSGSGAGGSHGLSSTGGSNMGNSGLNNTGSGITTSNSALGVGNTGGSGAGINSTSNSKSSSSSSSSYKDKDKHSKSFNKISSSSKDKDRDGSSSSSSSRESRDKSSKSAKLKELSSSTSVGNASNDQNNTPNSAGAQNLTISSSPLGVSSNNSGVKDLSKISSSSFGGDSHVSNIDSSNFGNSNVDSAVSMASTSSGLSSSGKSSSNSSIAKKRKADSKSSTIAEDSNSSFMMKDVSVTLTPLQQTDFEKEIERNSKKQKTELSPPTHQSVTELQNVSPNITQSSGPTSTTSNASSTTNAAISSSIHKQTTANSGGSQVDSKLPTSVNVSAAISTTSSSTHSHKASSLSSSAKDHHRDDRLRSTPPTSTQMSGSATAATSTTQQSTGSSAHPNAPSLYVSVPLSTANVPGINLPSTTTPTTTVAGSSDINSTAAPTGRVINQQGITAQTGNATLPSASAPMGGGSSGMLERQSPRILHQSPALSEHSSNFPSMQSPHGVIHQSGKSPSPSIGTTSGLGLTATTTESGNLKISYEKQVSRVTQLQEQESAPVRRSRTPDSGVFSSSSFNVSGGSTSSTIGGLSNGGLKFSYEAQTSVGSSSTPPTIDLNLPPTTFKDSPPSSPGSEAGSLKKRGRKPGNKAVTEGIGATNDFKDVKIFQNGIGGTTTSAPPIIMASSATHMLGNQLNPNSSVAQKLSDQLHMEIQDHSIYTPDSVTPQFVGVPFPGKLRNSGSTASSSSSSTPAPAASAGATSLASMFGSGMNGNLAIPQSLEQLLERQWEQGSQFLMEQAQHFDIASLLSCLHQLQSENVRLEEHVTSLIARRDHLLAVNARLAIPLSTNTSQSQASTSVTVTSAAAAATLATAATTSVSGTTNTRLPPTSSSSAAPSTIARNNSCAQQSTSQGTQQMSVVENGMDFRQITSSSSAAATTTAAGVLASSAPTTTSQPSAATIPLSLRHSSSIHTNYSSTPTTANLSPALHNNPSNIHTATTMQTMPAASAMATTTTAAGRAPQHNLQSHSMPSHQQQQQQQQQHHHHQHQQHQQQQQQQQQHQHHHMQHSSTASSANLHSQQQSHHLHQQHSHHHQPPQQQQQQHQHQHTHIHPAHTHSTHTHTSSHLGHHDLHPMASAIRVGGSGGGGGGGVGGSSAGRVSTKARR